MSAWGMRWPGAEVGRAAEAAGCAAFCAGEFVGSNVYVELAQMAAATTTARIGTGVAYAFARSPFIHASAIRHLHRSAPDRLFLGLGAGTRTMNERWFGAAADRPLARMGELVGAINAYLRAANGERIVHAGEFYDLDATIAAPVLGALDVPVVLGAFNPGMARLAGRVAHGVIGHGLFTDRWWQEVIEPALAEGAHQAGRDPDDLLRWGWVITSVDDDDPARADRDARLMVGFYVTVKTYDALIARHGWQRAVDDIRNAFRSRDFDAMAAAVPDDMVQSMAIFGSSAEARDQLAARRRLPDLRFHSAPSFLVSPRRAAAYGEATVTLLGGST